MKLFKLPLVCLVLIPFSVPAQEINPSKKATAVTEDDILRVCQAIELSETVLRENQEKEAAHAEEILGSVRVRLQKAPEVQRIWKDIRKSIPKELLLKLKAYGHLVEAHNAFHQAWGTSKGDEMFWSHLAAISGGEKPRKSESVRDYLDRRERQIVRDPQFKEFVIQASTRLKVLGLDAIMAARSLEMTSPSDGITFFMNNWSDDDDSVAVWIDGIPGDKDSYTSFHVDHSGTLPTDERILKELKGYAEYFGKDYSAPYSGLYRVALQRHETCLEILASEEPGASVVAASRSISGRMDANKREKIVTHLMPEKNAKKTEASTGGRK